MSLASGTVRVHTTPEYNPRPPTATPSTKILRIPWLRKVRMHWGRRKPSPSQCQQIIDRLDYTSSICPLTNPVVARVRSLFSIRDCDGRGTRKRVGSLLTRCRESGRRRPPGSCFSASSGSITRRTWQSRPSRLDGVDEGERDDPRTTGLSGNLGWKYPRCATVTEA
ncbi:hypothetical protein CMUS01_06502 [Colletotrichum musicola]|uniref:Uncharacterized protein n=1 Tax=Colletotrichum musicola TaxID=2175873 RepID=A0A8H6KMD7_9PEZI|nr:hypothetical protein CMUS01_06502 [Colletotrichum musicola]